MEDQSKSNQDNINKISQFESQQVKDKNTITEKENQITILNQEISNLKETISKNKDEISSLSSRLTELSINSQIEVELKAIKDTLSEKDKEIKKLKSSKKKKVEQKDKQITSLESSIKEKETEIASLKQQIEELSNKNSALESDLNSSKAEISILSSDTRAVFKAKTLKEKETIIKNLKETNTKMFNELKGKISENESIQKELNEIKEKEKLYIEEITQLKDTNTKLNNRLNLVSSTAITFSGNDDGTVSVDSPSNDIVTNNDKYIAHLKEKISLLEANYKNAKELIESLKSSNEENSKLLKKVLNDNKNLQNDLHQSKPSTNDSNIFELKESYDSYKKEIEILFNMLVPDNKVKYEDTTKFISVFKENVTKLITKNKKYKDTIGKLTKMINDERKEKGNLTAIQTDLLEKLNKRDLQVNEYKEQIQNLIKTSSNNQNTIPFSKYEQILSIFSQEEEKYKKDIEKLKEENEKMRNAMSNNDSLSLSSLITETKQSVKHNRQMSQPNVGNERLFTFERTDTRNSNKSFVFENYEKNMEDSENLFQEQLKVLKDELRRTKKDLEQYKKAAMTMDGSKNDLIIVLKQTFEKLIGEIQINSKNKDFVIMMMKVIGYKEDEINTLIKKGKKGFLGMFK